MGYRQLVESSWATQGALRPVVVLLTEIRDQAAAAEEARRYDELVRRDQTERLIAAILGEKVAPRPPTPGG